MYCIQSRSDSYKALLVMGSKSTIVVQETLDVIVITVHGNIAVHKNMRFLSATSSVKYGDPKFHS